MISCPFLAPHVWLPSRLPTLSRCSTRTPPDFYASVDADVLHPGDVGTQSRYLRDPQQERGPHTHHTDECVCTCHTNRGTTALTGLAIARRMPLEVDGTGQ